MIPKIIHLCWLSGDPYPADIQRCLDSWKEYLPDYEVMLWDRKRFDVNSTLWTKQAFENRKYAFAADYIRLYALYNYGGIYLDSDVLMYKSFDDLLHLPYFMGCDFVGSFEPAVLGFEKHSPVIGHVLKHYDGRSFVKPDGSFDTLPLPDIFVNELTPLYKFRLIRSATNYKSDEGGVLNVFTRDFFNSRTSVGPRKTKYSYCSHCYAASWVERGTDFKSRLSRSLPKNIKRVILWVTNRLHKKRFDKCRIKFLYKE